MEFNLYKDPKTKLLDPELFSGTAHQVAKEWSGTTSTQIRKFFDEVLLLREQSKGGDSSEKEAKWARILPFVKMLNAKVAYAYGRGNLKNDTFVKFIQRGTSQINEVEDLETFSKFFEACIGFHKYEEQLASNKNKRRGSSQSAGRRR